jgi:hypothetical protein
MFVRELLFVYSRNIRLAALLSTLFCFFFIHNNNILISYTAQRVMCRSIGKYDEERKQSIKISVRMPSRSDSFVGTRKSTLSHASCSQKATRMEIHAEGEQKKLRKSCSVFGQSSKRREGKIPAAEKTLKKSDLQQTKKDIFFSPCAK